jgi:glycogen debranching enzyme
VTTFRVDERGVGDAPPGSARAPRDAGAVQRAQAVAAAVLLEGYARAEALEKGGRQVASVSSNAAQVLWTGIASADHARRIADRMMRPDMFSGWGIRTMSADHVRFDPLAYQQGSVWAFDNALIVSGLRRYGQDTAALRVVAATLDAARSFRLERLPEFIAGMQRLQGDGPVHTPRADPLQAWSAAAVPFMVSELLDIRSDGFDHRLHVHRPLLPDGVDTLVLHDMQVAGTAVLLRFARVPGGVSAEVDANSGQVELVVT